MAVYTDITDEELALFLAKAKGRSRIETSPMGSRGTGRTLANKPAQG